jgi:DNA-binding MarR family transcriptional regulator/ribosomal protein S18 acetylase RimI-like enzyme
MQSDAISLIRAFNRTVTQRVGALDESYLARGRPLGEARLLHQIGRDGKDVRSLREALKLDSGYLSRMLRSLESQGLAYTTEDRADARVRRVSLTEAGLEEFGRYDALSNDLAQSFLSPLDAVEQERLVKAIAEVLRLLRAGEVEICMEDPASEAAQHCLAQYFRELARRFDAGFDPTRSNSATLAELSPPTGVFVVARLDGAPVGCGALKMTEGGIGEIKRMWTDVDARGLGIARRILRKLESEAMVLGLQRLQLETNRTLVEAQSLYRSAGYAEVARFNDEPYAHHWFEKRL